MENRTSKTEDYARPRGLIDSEIQFLILVTLNILKRSDRKKRVE